jgi:tellurite resistance protein TerC
LDLQLPLWFEITSIIVLLLIITADLVLAYKRPHIPSTRESSLWISFYVLLALIFAVLMFLFAGAEQAGQFVAGWLTEYSLSIDNLFVFVIIMARFSVPRKYQQEVLMVGIIIALVLRAIFILLGAQLIENFSWIFYIFGAFLLYTAFGQAFQNNEEMDEKESGIIRFLRKRVPISNDFDGAKLRTVILKYGIAFILAFIGLKLVANAMRTNELPFINGGKSIEWAPEIGTFLSLGVIVASMAVAVIASLIKIRYDRRRAE